MWRRYSILSVLLLSLWGVIPTAAACAFMAQQGADCCAGSAQPCDSDGTPRVVVVSDSSFCCSARPLATGSTAAVEGQRDLRLADPMPPEHAKAPVPAFPSSFSALRERTALAVASPIKLGHPQVYLLTGRLRL